MAWAAGAEVVVSKGVGAGLALCGIGMLVFGIYLLTICTPMMFGFCMPTYTGPGILLIILGIIVAVLGGVLPAATAPGPPQPTYPSYMPYGYAPAYGGQYAPAYGAYPAYPAYGQPGPVPPQQYYGQVAAPQQASYGQPPAAPPAPTAPPQAPVTARLCAGCGAPVAVQFCPACGTQAW